MSDHITGWITWGNGEPCPICGRPPTANPLSREDIDHLLSHPEAMARLFPKKVPP